MVGRSRVRAAFVVAVLVAAALLANGATGYDGTVQGAADREVERPLAERSPVAPPTDGVTVVAARGFPDHDESAALLAFAPDGRPLYYDNSLAAYWDVDPSPAGEATVLYVGRTTQDGRAMNVVERANLTTGAVERLYAEPDGGEWRAIDPINDTHVLVGSVEDDRAFVLEVATGRVTWEWIAEGRNPHHAGDTEVSDVGRLPDGRVFVNLPRRDTGLFVDRRRGVREAWTVGEVHDHTVLYHQGDLDYLPADAGGPAVLAADTGNDRVVEYQRRDGEWERSWVWTSPRLDDPRDAERLPDGRTLVANTGRDEVLALSPEGEIVWSADVVRPYDVERLAPSSHGSHGSHGGQGSHGSNGDHGHHPPAAVSVGLESRATPDPVWAAPYGQYIRVGLQRVGLDGLLDLLPYWITEEDLPAVVLLGGALAGWLLAELWWANGRLERTLPSLNSDRGS